jgi:hypothetical protein
VEGGSRGRGREVRRERERQGRMGHWQGGDRAVCSMEEAVRRGRGRRASGGGESRPGRNGLRLLRLLLLLLLLLLWLLIQKGEGGHERSRPHGFPKQSLPSRNLLGAPRAPLVAPHKRQLLIRDPSAALAAGRSGSLRGRVGNGRGLGGGS